MWISGRDIRTKKLLCTDVPYSNVFLNAIKTRTRATIFELFLPKRLAHARAYENGGENICQNRE